MEGTRWLSIVRRRILRSNRVSLERTVDQARHSTNHERQKPVLQSPLTTTRNLSSDHPGLFNRPTSALKVRDRLSTVRSQGAVLVQRRSTCRTTRSRRLVGRLEDYPPPTKPSSTEKKLVFCQPVLIHRPLLQAFQRRLHLSSHRPGRSKGGRLPTCPFDHPEMPNVVSPQEGQYPPDPVYLCRTRTRLPDQPCSKGWPRRSCLVHLLI